MKVVVTHPVPPPAVDLLRECGYDVVVGESEDPYNPSALAALVAGADGVVALLIDRIDAAVLEAAGPQLRVVSNFAVGHDNVDLGSAARSGVRIGNTPDVLTQAVAEHTFALLLAAARRIVEGDRIVRERRYRRWGPSFLLGMELKGKTIAIVGSGRIGRAVAHIAEGGFGMKAEFVRRGADLRAALVRADAVTLHVPLTAETQHLIGRDELRAMKPSAILVNTSRGPVVDESALVEALRTGEIAGAALDVYEHEPDLAEGLAELENVVLAPHTASATQEARSAMSRLAAENVIAALEGRPMPSEVPLPAVGRAP
jgi:lactate dehydrogenase-like 2-hydroxyacid dehydrogenase